MSIWEKKDGIAVINHTYIASGPHQITTIVGDHFQVIEASENWFRGKNLYTKQIGIFPKCCCDFFVNVKPDQRNELLSKSNDILFHETTITVRYALNVMLKVHHERAVTISDRINDVVNQYELCQNHQDGKHALEGHLNLATNLDNLRQVLNLDYGVRSFYSSLATLSTLGRNLFDSSLKRTDDNNLHKGYTLLHCSVDVKMVKENLNCRFFIYSPSLKKLISSTSSVYITPELTTYEIIFDYLDLRDLTDTNYLCIYAYDISSNKSERKFASCALVEIPPINQQNFGLCVTSEVQSITSSKQSILQTLHLILTSDTYSPDIEKTISRCSPYYTIRITPYFGLKEKIIASQNIQKCTIIPPLLLPSSISHSEKKAFLTVNFNNLHLDVRHSKSRFILRIINKDKKEFVPGFENILAPSYDSLTWYSPIFGGKKDNKVYETTSIDLTISGEPLESLYLVIEIDKAGFSENKFSPCAYGIIHLTNDIGCFTSDTQSSVKLYPLNSSKSIQPDNFLLTHNNNEKQIGHIDSQLYYASTILTQDVTLFKLLHYEKFPNEINENIERFMFCGITEWGKFTPQINLVLWQIISKMPSSAKPALNALISMYSELSSNNNNIVEEIINSKYTKDNIQSLKDLAEPMVSLILEILNRDESTQEFRSLIRTLPYLLTLASYSLNINPKVEIKNKIVEIFDYLCKLIGEDTINEENKLKKSTMNVNQRLLLEHFSLYSDVLTQTFEVEKAIDIICKFISSIHPGNDTLMHDKMDLLLNLCSKGLWQYDNNNKLKSIYTNEIVKGLKEMNHMDYILQMLTSILYSKSPDFIISFLPQLEINFDISKDPKLNNLILLIAYTYPQLFPLKFLAKLCSEAIKSYIPPYKVLFVLTNNIYAIRNELIENIKNEPNGIGFNLFIQYLELINKSCNISIASPLDEQIDYHLYADIDIKIVLNIYKLLPDSVQLNYNMILPLFRTFLNFNSKLLVDWYDLIYQCDFRINNNYNKVKSYTLDALWKLSKDEKFSLLSEFGKDDGFQGTFENISIIRKLSNDLTLNQDELAESLSYLYKVSDDLSNDKKKYKFLKYLIKINKINQNNAETAKCLLKILPLIPCDNSKVPKLLDYESEFGRELHAEIMFDIVENYIESDYEIKALKILDQIVSTCVKPSQHIELLIKVKDFESKIYDKITKYSILGPRYYYRCSFFGCFDKKLKDKTFIYRRNKSINLDKMTNEIKNKYQNATISSDPPPANLSQDAMYIQITNVNRIRECEYKDMYNFGDFKKSKCHLIEDETAKSKIFRYKKIHFNDNTNKTLNQFAYLKELRTFFIIKDNFSFSRREEVIKISEPKVISSVEYGIYSLAYRNYQILFENYWIQEEYKKFKIIPDKAIISIIEKNFVSYLKNLPLKSFGDAFFNEDFLKEFPNEAQNIEKFKKYLYDHYIIVKNVYEFLQKFGTGAIPTNENSFNTHKESLSKFIKLD